MDDTRVAPHEITALLKELRRLLELGDTATYDEWLAYHEHKADVLHRIAANPGELVDATEAAEVAEEATEQVERLRCKPSLIGGRE